MAEKRKQEESSDSPESPTEVSSLAEKSSYKSVDVPDENPKPGPQVEQVPGKP